MKTFEEFELSPFIQRALGEMGLVTPTPIQAQALPILLGEQPTDFLGLAATGTGKTVAFGAPLLNGIDLGKKKVQGLILCPTRELALQVSGQINLLGKHLGVRITSVYGGASYTDQIRGLKQGAQIVVGTPGRIVDHMNRGTLDFSELQTVVLDEADEMISMGFRDDLEAILNASPRESSRIWLFCATMSREVRQVADKYLRNPQRVEVNRKEMVPEAIEQIYYRTHESDKPEIVCKLIDAASDFYGIVFCQTKILVTNLTQYLRDRGYAVDCLHGDMDQGARERTMQGFRNRRVKILVCTDVASRGLDVKDITHVINYSLPRELESYVHRIGRTARSGKTGFAMSLVTPSHRMLVGRIEQLTKSKMKEGKLPTRKEIGVKKVSQLLQKFNDQTAFARAAELMDGTWKTAVAEMDRNEIVGRFLSLAFPEIFADRSDEREAPVSSAPSRDHQPQRGGHYKPQHGRAESRYQDRDDRGDRPAQVRPAITSPGVGKVVKSPWKGAAAPAAAPRPSGGPGFRPGADKPLRKSRPSFFDKKRKGGGKDGFHGRGAQGRS